MNIENEYNYLPSMRRTSMISTIVVELESTRVVTIGAADTVYVAFFSLFLKRRGTLNRQCQENY
jgi:hypothetical protein